MKLRWAEGATVEVVQAPEGAALEVDWEVYDGLSRVEWLGEMAGAPGARARLDELPTSRVSELAPGVDLSVRVVARAWVDGRMVGYGFLPKRRIRLVAGQVQLVEPTLVTDLDSAFELPTGAMVTQAAVASRRTDRVPDFIEWDQSDLAEDLPGVVVTENNLDRNTDPRTEQWLEVAR